MSNVERIFINMSNLTDEQQLKLWSNLWTFADQELPSNTDLMCFVVSKQDNQKSKPVNNDIKDSQNTKTDNTDLDNNDEYYNRLNKIEILLVVIFVCNIIIILSIVLSLIFKYL